MSKESKFSWLISAKTFTDLVGVEYNLLKQSGEVGLPRFYLAGFSIILIFVLSFISIYYAFDMMFNRWQVELFLSAFFSFLFVLIYILLIHTFSKSVLPSMNSKIFLNTSNVLRVGYVIFMGFIISQPLEALILKEKLDVEISTYRNTLLDDFKKRATVLYMDEDPNAGAIKIQTINGKAAFKINSSEFLIKRVQILNSKYPASWVICLLVIALFFLPGFLVYSISGHNDYYQAKHDYEKNLVVTDYEIFKEKYSNLFKEKFKVNDIVFYEPFENPPFNTIRKKDKDHKNQEDFINKILYGL